MSGLDVLSIRRGSITAPAGCGKTNLIATALKRYQGVKPVLILTHTNAGVSALRTRLAKEGVAAASSQVRTIDGWAIQLVATFPTKSGVAARVLELKNPRDDYPAIRRGAITLLRSGHLTEIFRASYQHVLVDEYQDCSMEQHELVRLLSEILGTCIFGDPLQAIFNFGPGGVAPWDTVVTAHFPVVADLHTPWRWLNAQSEVLGVWLLKVREDILLKRPIDLGVAPPAVQWIRLDGAADQAKLVTAAKTKAPVDGGTVLVIGESINASSRYRIASAVKGMVTVEAVDLGDLVKFAQGFDVHDDLALTRLVDFAETMMANVGGIELLKRVKLIQEKKNRKDPNDVEKFAILFDEDRSYKRAAELLVALGRDFGVETFRPDLVQACLRALNGSHGDPTSSFEKSVLQMREQNRLSGRALPKRSIGSTLLLKGLEADVVVVLHADQLDAKNLYVAITRGSRKLVICSSNQILRPR